MSHKVGRFSVEVWSPFPVWVTIKDEDGNAIKFTHRELRDLEYAVAWAIKQAQQNLKTPSGDLSNEV